MPGSCNPACKLQPQVQDTIPFHSHSVPFHSNAQAGQSYLSCCRERVWSVEVWKQLLKWSLLRPQQVTIPEGWDLEGNYFDQVGGSDDKTRHSIQYSGPDPYKASKIRTSTLNFTWQQMQLPKQGDPEHIRRYQSLSELLNSIPTVVSECCSRAVLRHLG